MRQPGDLGFAARAGGGISNPARHRFTVLPSLKFEVVLACLLGVPYAVVATLLCMCDDWSTRTAFLLSTCFPLAITSYSALPKLVKALQLKGLCNINLHQKEGSERVAEPGSLWACLLYLIYLVGLGAANAGPNDIAIFNCALVAITTLTILGLVDDIVQLGWFSKVAVPGIVAIHICKAFPRETVLTVPRVLPLIGGHAINIGSAYYASLVLLAIFFVNAINIYAVGESAIIAIFVVAHNCLELSQLIGAHNGLEAAASLERHLVSLKLTLPFLAVSAGLLCYNWYPASIFVGNIYTSMAVITQESFPNKVQGALLAANALLCGTSALMLLLFLPQIANFVLSIPQVCYKWLQAIHICVAYRNQALSAFQDPVVSYVPDLLEYSNNYTLLNALLWLLGPMAERDLSVLCLGIQVLCCVIGLAVYHFAVKHNV
ncbi:N-acetylglucosamine-1-phosphate transferase, putative [Babesia bigemina]|uniref:UDP-N-acetylglucosamine--dolichyl-phosphate N-acetylglucosaminephosphotransferase n=1 Tax=Babesia bigemina TaxID=5866 RepID=A0A061DAX3_BABBI|nr:N-acetylglucosamine-1-phosphate transferase, putative [Babesia bigemina]CDR97806.1 N-acetylglucosamine-1-phosphate transferase, putative [Babesia bigemina]|eukprot:XP_012769992.1 N-acetylglucosamine-1-phosphate transferase, putative [Babesia bigemina]